jgi:hypothetical protein
MTRCKFLPGAMTKPQFSISRATSISRTPREIDGNGLSARVAFDFELRDSKTGTTVWNRSYSHDEPVNGKDVSAVVAAMDRNVQSGLSEVLEGLDKYFSTRSAVASTVAP